MAEKKITRKELFELAKTAVEGGITLTDEQAEALVEMFDKYIVQLSKPRKKSENKEAAEFRAAVATWLADHEGAYTLAEIAADMDVSWQKVSAAVRRLVDEGAAVRVEPENKKDKVAFTVA